MVIALTIPAVQISRAETASGVIDESRSATTSRKHVRMRYEPSPYPIPLNVPFALQVQTENDGPKISSLVVTGWMPAHQHGMNLRPRVTAESGVRWKVEGMLFHMAGHWQIFVDIVVDGGSDRAVFDVIVE